MSQETNEKGRAAISESSPGTTQRAERACRDELACLLREVRRSASAFSRVYRDSMGQAEAEESTEPLFASVLDVVAAADRAVSALEACPDVSEESLSVVASARAALELTEIGLSLLIAGHPVEDYAA